MTNKNLEFIFFLIILTFFFSQVVLAQDISFTPQVGIGDEIKAGEKIPISGATLATYLIAIYNWALRAIVILAIVMIMVAGFRWLTAGGNAALVSQARDQITSSLIGLLIAIGSYALLNFINPSLVRFKSLDLAPIEEISGFRNCGACNKGQICVRKSKSEIQGYCVDKVKVWLKYAAGTVVKEIELKALSSVEGIRIRGIRVNPLWSWCGNIDSGVHIGSECETDKICVIEDNIYTEENPFILPLGMSYKTETGFGFYEGAECIQSTGLWCPGMTTEEECEHDVQGSRIACEWFGGKCVDQACTSMEEGGLSCGGNCGEVAGIGAIPTGGIKVSQCQDASPALTKFLTCMNKNSKDFFKKIEKEDWNFMITSISDDVGLKKCRDSYEKPPCAHEKNSAHYGGKDRSVDGSYAADFKCMYGEEQLKSGDGIGAGYGFKDLVKECGGSFNNECTDKYVNKHYHTSVPVK